MDIFELSVGDILECRDYHKVTQQQIDQFANATGDKQWIHIDVERCKTQSPFKTTIAHGFLTLSIMPQMYASCVTVDPETTTLINYGMDSLRFIEPVCVNDEIKYLFELINIESKAMGQVYKFKGTVLIKGKDKPALIGEFLSLVIEN